MKKCLVIFNPTSGKEDHDQALPKLKERLERDFDEVLFKETKEEGDGKKFAGEACREKFHSLFVVGGDGSLNEVVNGLAEKDHRPILGVLPGGTNNTYYQLLGKNKSLEDAIDAIDLAKTRKVDLGKCNDYYFSYYACFGHLIDASTATPSEEKEKLGGLAYFKNVLKALPTDQTHSIQITSDGGDYRGPASHVYCLLVDQIGDLDFSEIRTSLSSGKIYTFILTDAKTGSKLSAIKDMALGKLNENESIRSLVCTKIKIESTEGEDVDLDLDGEIGPKLPADIEVLPSHLEVYLPRED